MHNLPKPPPPPPRIFLRFHESSETRGGGKQQSRTKAGSFEPTVSEPGRYDAHGKENQRPCAYGSGLGVVDVGELGMVILAASRSVGSGDEHQFALGQAVETR